MHVGVTSFVAVIYDIYKYGSLLHINELKFYHNGVYYNKLAMIWGTSDWRIILIIL